MDPSLSSSSFIVKIREFLSKKVNWLTYKVFKMFDVFKCAQNVIKTGISSTNQQTHS